MMFCRNCGQEIDDNAIVCPNCGTAQKADPNMYVSNPMPNAPADTGGILWGLLGCCIPIVGLILFLVWKNEKPNTAKAAGIGAIVGVVCVVIWYIALFAIGIMSADIYY